MIFQKVHEVLVVRVFFGNHHDVGVRHCHFIRILFEKVLAFNNAHDYRPVLLNPAVYQPFWFDSNVALAFPYTLGAGVQTMINPNWQVAVGYQFADLGKSYLRGDQLVLNKGLRLTHFYTNEALVSISYVFS